VSVKPIGTFDHPNLDNAFLVEVRFYPNIIIVRKLSLNILLGIWS
jgi:hypothetical protein